MPNHPSDRPGMFLLACSGLLVAFPIAASCQQPLPAQSQFDANQDARPKPPAAKDKEKHIGYSINAFLKFPSHPPLYGFVTGPEAGWTSTFGNLRIWREKERLVGAYTHDAGKLSNITVDQNGWRIHGTWTEFDGSGQPTDSGPFCFYLRTDERSFAGYWKYTGDSCDEGLTWDGEGGPFPPAGPYVSKPEIAALSPRSIFPGTSKTVFGVEARYQVRVPPGNVARGYFVCRGVPKGDERSTQIAEMTASPSTPSVFTKTVFCGNFSTVTLGLSGAKTIEIDMTIVSDASTWDYRKASVKVPPPKSAQ